MFAEVQFEIEKIIKATWQNWEGDATEKITLRETKEGILVESIITNAGQENFTVRYTISCDASWRVRKLEIESTEKKKDFGLNQTASAGGQITLSPSRRSMEQLTLILALLLLRIRFRYAASNSKKIRPKKF